MLGKNRMEYVIKTCPAENAQELQNLLNEMSMKGWELYSMTEIGGDEDEPAQLNCIFMREAKSAVSSGDIISISDFKSQMEKMLSPKMTEYEKCLEIQNKIKQKREEINQVKAQLDAETPVPRKKLNDKISSGLKALDDLKGELNKATSPDLMYSKLHEDKLAIYLSEELLGFVDSERADFEDEQLVAETVKARLDMTETHGYVIPKVVFKDDESLNPCEFCIKIRGMEVFRAAVYPECKMFYADELHTEHKIKNSFNADDIITDKKVIWVPKDKANNYWQESFTSSQYIAKALEYVAIKHVEDLLDYEDIEKYLDVVEKENPYLIDNIVPDVLTYADIKYIMVSLIKENVSIKNITYIFEKINDYAEDGSKVDIINKIRLALSRQICSKYVNDDGETISVFDLSDKTYSELVLDCDESDESIVKIDADFAQKLANKVKRKAKKMNIDYPKLMVPIEYRQILFSLLSLYLNNIVVIAQEEIGAIYKTEILGEI